ncbi:sensor histidine kinase [Catenuloplanes japonicus]|uniref:sensor histidine kinase n=1 Tax=Catenuloplanes japonicus TaxID=33876 RepID=UPI0005265212|nr:HAMP domain-containing sensor histidine kinase [Catenuloplanes japonicus]
MSLRARLLAICLVLLTAGLLVSDAVAVGYLRGHLVDRVDSQLRLLSAVARIAPPGLSGEVFTDRLDMVSEVRIEFSTAYAGPFDTPYDNGDRRVVWAPRADGTGSVGVSARLDEVDGAVRRMWLVTGGTALLVLAVLAVAGRFAVHAGLRPLRRIESTAAAIAGGDLSHRVPVLAPPRTEVGRLAASLNVMLEQLAAAFDARARSEERMRAFLGDVSHELRTPLFGIRGFTELYRMGGVDIDRTITHIRRETSRLAGLAEDLLLLTRLEEPGVLQVSPMDLRTVAADAYLEVRALDPSRPVTLTGLASEGAPGSAPVIGDESRLRQVVTNLIGNAVTHTPAGTPVRIGVGAVDGFAVLEVADSGPGLSPAQAARVFERFYRVTPAGGTGLGLSIVRSLVEAHGGEVTVRSAPGQGAVFRVSLPRN